VSKLSLELVEHGLSKASRYVADDADDGTTDRVLGILGTEDTLYAM
jgi:hypothetical protein